MYIRPRACTEENRYALRISFVSSRSSTAVAKSLDRVCPRYTYIAAARHFFWYIIFNSAALTYTLNFHYNVICVINNNIVRA